MLKKQTVRFDLTSRGMQQTPRSPQIILLSAADGTYLDRLRSRMINQMILLVFVLIMSAVWAGVICKMIMETTATSRLVLNLFTVVAFAPAITVIALMITIVSSTISARKKIVNAYQ